MGARQDDEVAGGRLAADIQRPAEGEIGRGYLDGLDRIARGDGKRGVGRAGIDDDGFNILNRLLGNTGKQLSDVLLFVVAPDDD